MTHPTISQKAVEAALDSYDNPLAPYGWRNASGALQAQLRFDMERAIRAALAVDGLVLVDQGALDWLFGEAPDRDGKWFGECEDAMKLTAGKYKRAYWWRSKFRAMLSAAPTGTGWRPINSAPKDGRKALVFRPLAHNTNDQPITVKRLIGGNHYCWPGTVPEGQTPYNPTDGACHVTHWMPLPAAPTGTEG